MRPTLSSLVRSVLLSESHEVLASSKSAADETVIVDAPVSKFHPPGTRPDSYATEEDQLRISQDASKTLRYINTDKWRDAVIRQFKFLDRHEKVGDVQVRPVVIDDIGHIPGKLTGLGTRGSSGRALVVDGAEGEGLLRQISVRDDNVRVDRDARRRVLSQASAEVGDLAVEMTIRDNITVVPIMGRQNIASPTPDNLPSAWMVVHSIFDNLHSATLPGINGLVAELEGILALDYANSKASIGALLNCGWGENLHTLIMQHRDARSIYDFHGRTGMQAGVPVGKKIVEPARPKKVGERSLQLLTDRPLSDYIAEILTICAVKPQGLQMKRDLIKDLPDWLLLNDYVRYRKGISDQDYEGYRETTPEIRQELEGLLLRDLNAIEAVVKGTTVRDTMVADLVGKVMFIFVH